MEVLPQSAELAFPWFGEGRSMAGTLWAEGDGGARGCLASGACPLALLWGWLWARDSGFALSTGSRLVEGLGHQGPPPQGLCFRLGLPTQRDIQRHIRETSQVEGPQIFSSVSLPRVGMKSHEGDILQRQRKQAHSVQGQHLGSIWSGYHLLVGSGNIYNWSSGRNRESLTPAAAHRSQASQGEWLPQHTEKKPPTYRRPWVPLSFQVSGEGLWAPWGKGAFITSGQHRPGLSLGGPPHSPCSAFALGSGVRSAPAWTALGAKLQHFSETWGTFTQDRAPQAVVHSQNIAFPKEPMGRKQGSVIGQNPKATWFLQDISEQIQSPPKYRTETNHTVTST